MSDLFWSGCFGWTVQIMEHVACMYVTWLLRVASKVAVVKPLDAGSIVIVDCTIKLKCNHFCDQNKMIANASK